MKHKKFIVEDMSEAMQKIKKELGSDAVILDSRKIKVGGFLGFFKKTKLEVIAILEEPKEIPKSAKNQQKQEEDFDPFPKQNQNLYAIYGKNPPSSGNPPKNTVYGHVDNHPPYPNQQPPYPPLYGGQEDYGYEQQGRTLPNGEHTSYGYPPQVPHPLHRNGEFAPPSSPPIPYKGEENPHSYGYGGQQSNHLPSTPPTYEPKVREEGSRSNYPNQATELIAQRDEQTQLSHIRDQIQKLEKEGEKEKSPSNEGKEIKELKNMLFKFMVNEENKDKIPPGLYHLKKKLLEEQETDEDIALEIIEMLTQNLTEDELRNDKKVEEETKKIMIEYLGHFIPKEKQPIQNDVKVVFFVGPTGVGKTTTIAKIAAEQVLKLKRKVGFISSDTFRIGAVDQLKNFADILKIPMEVVFSPEEIEGAFEKLKECELILFDTTGRNYRDKKYIEEVNKLLEIPKFEHFQTQGTKQETFLVLSLSSNYADLIDIMENFKKVKIDKVLFTKVDETSRFGPIFNIISKYNYSLSYLTNGQQVPNDIIVADSKNITNLILGVDERVNI